MSSKNGQQRDRHIVVTGAGTGIGRAIALRLAADGRRLSLMGRRTGLLDETAALVVAAGGAAPACIGVDVRDAESVTAGFAAAARSMGPIQGLVANAGVGGPNSAGDGDRYEALVEVNLIGTYRCLRAAQANLAPGPERRDLVVISSILGRFGVPGYTGYCASKAGLLGLVKALAMEVAEDGVQVNAVCPGWVDTDMAWEGIDGMAAAMGISRDEAHKMAMSAVPLRRMGKPAEVAGLVAWLLSADAAGVIGQGLDINGGAWMG